MKQKLLLVLVGCLAATCFALLGCTGGDSVESSDTSSTTEVAETGEAADTDATDADADSSDTGTTAAASGDAETDVLAMAAKYGVDDPESVTDKRVDLSTEYVKTTEELLAIYEDLSSNGIAEGYTFAQVMEKVGCDPNKFKYFSDSGNYSFNWYASDASASYLGASFKNQDGNWVFSGASKTNM